MATSSVNYICEFCKKSFTLRGYKCKKCNSAYCVQCMSYLQGCICESKVKQAYVNNKFSSTSYKARSKTIKHGTLASLADTKRQLSPKQQLQIAESEEECSINSANVDKRPACEPIKLEKKIQQLQYEVNSLKGSMSSIRQVNSDMLSNITSINVKIDQLETVCKNKEFPELATTKRTSLEPMDFHLHLLKAQIIEECDKKMSNYAAQLQEFINYQHIAITNQMKEALIKIPKYEMNSMCVCCNKNGAFKICEVCKLCICNKCKCACSICNQRMCKKCQVQCGHCTHSICEKCSIKCERCRLSACKASVCKQIIFLDCQNSVYRGIASAFINSPLIYNHLRQNYSKDDYTLIEYINQRRGNFPYVDINYFKEISGTEEKVLHIINTLLLGKSEKEDTYIETGLLNQKIMEFKVYEKYILSPTIIQKMAHCQVCNKEYVCLKPKYVFKSIAANQIPLDWVKECNKETKHVCDCKGIVVLSKKSILHVGNILICQESITDATPNEVLDCSLSISKTNVRFTLEAAVLLKDGGSDYCLIKRKDGINVIVGNKWIEFKNDFKLPLNSNALLVYLRK